MLPWSKRSEKTTSPEHTTGRTKPSPTEKSAKQLRCECSRYKPNFKSEKPHLHSVAACDRPETIEIPKLLQIPEVVWQQPSETSIEKSNLDNTNNDFTIQFTQATSKTTVANQMSPPKGTQPQNYVVAKEHLPGNQTGNKPGPLLNCSKNRPTDTQNSQQHVTTTLNGVTTTPLLSTATQ